MNSIDTLLITGSNGFVGQSLLEYVENLSEHELPKRVVTVNRNNSKKISPTLASKIEFHEIQFDLSKPWDFEVENATVVNLAADGSETSYSSTASESFVSISNNLSNWAIRNKPRTIFHASSGACYGIVPLKIEEDEKPSSREAESKKDSFIRARLQSENLLRGVLKNENIEIVIGRLFSFVGPKILEKKQYAVSSLIDSALRSNRVLVKGNPETIRSYLHEEDMSHWIYKALHLENQTKPLSIGSSVKVRLSELADFIANATKTHVEYNDPASYGDIYVADNSETLECLGVTETKNWQDSVIQCIEAAKGAKN